MVSTCNLCLGIVIMIQFYIIITLMANRGLHPPPHRIEEPKGRAWAPESYSTTMAMDNQQIQPPDILHHPNCSVLEDDYTKSVATKKKEVVGSYPGAAVFLNLHQPKWFQRRYTIMVQNVVNNLPDDWVIQIFWTGEGSSKTGIDINPGLQRFITSGKLVLTMIPKSVWNFKRKRFQLMVEPWIWENMLSDRVLVFGGTCVLCSNSITKVSNFSHLDYIGAPWDAHKGIGGDGSISLRNRNLMVEVLHYELDKVKDPKEKREAYKKWGQEDHFFVSRLIQMKKKGLLKANLASREETLQFSAIGSALNDDVFAVSGTLPSVTFSERNKFIDLCPEMKVFYPALHDPHCFGASPDGEQCAKNICALKPRSERKGGC